MIDGNYEVIKGPDNALLRQGPGTLLHFALKGLGDVIIRSTVVEPTAVGCWLVVGKTPHRRLSLTVKYRELSCGLNKGSAEVETLPRVQRPNKKRENAYLVT